MNIEFHLSHSGRSYIEDFLDDLHVNDRSEILAVFADIHKHGFNALGCQFRQLEGKLWEIKIKTASGGWRFFYVMLKSDLMHVLHCYKKQGQKAPKRELDIAKKRMREVLS